MLVRLNLQRNLLALFTSSNNILLGDPPAMDAAAGLSEAALAVAMAAARYDLCSCACCCGRRKEYTADAGRSIPSSEPLGCLCPRRCFGDPFLEGAKEGVGDGGGPTREAG